MTKFDQFWVWRLMNVQIFGKLTNLRVFINDRQIVTWIQNKHFEWSPLYKLTPWPFCVFGETSNSAEPNLNLLRFCSHGPPNLDSWQTLDKHLANFVELTFNGRCFHFFWEIFLFINIWTFCHYYSLFFPNVCVLKKKVERPKEKCFNSKTICLKITNDTKR